MKVDCIICRFYSFQMWAFLDYLKLIRIINCIIASAAVLIGAYFTWTSTVYYAPIMSAIAAFLVCAAGNVVNDIVDIDVDLINQPKRVLPAGDISKSAATKLAIALTILAVVVALSINWLVMSAVLLAIALLALYNFKAKKIPIFGNLIIALLGALTFLTGGLAVDESLTFALPGPIIPALFAFFFHLAREILKDVEDIEGDRRVGIRTFPQVVGESRAVLAVLVLFFIMVVLTFIPVLAGWFGKAYEILTIYIIDLPLLLLLIFIWGNPSRRMLRMGSIGL
ncbi:MAG: geranylgeranylglycerol-phosphate geranylgeranyltransferase, partial [candidate division Zixibacteria bacterium]|nr:geranylgeranylglycerol-phosphate geranylgeranyltransferase [candidate division Zixibacteria bacterium]